MSVEEKHSPDIHMDMHGTHVVKVDDRRGQYFFAGVANLTGEGPSFFINNDDDEEAPTVIFDWPREEQLEMLEAWYEALLSND